MIAIKNQINPGIARSIATPSRLITKSSSLLVTGPNQSPTPDSVFDADNLCRDSTVHSSPEAGASRLVRRARPWAVGRRRPIVDQSADRSHQKEWEYADE